MVERKSAGGERKALLILGAIAVLGGLAFGWGRLHAQPGHTAAVYLNGEQVGSFALSEYTEPVIIPMRELGFDVPVNFELRDGKIRFIDVDCPDKLCEGFGFISLPDETAVCMPNRVSVTILP